MYENLLKTLKNIGSPKVMVAGDFMLDIYLYGDALRISPEAPVPVLRVHRTEHSCGGAGSVVADLAELPAQAIKYIRRVEELIETPVALVSTSPEREDTVLVRDPFLD